MIMNALNGVLVPYLYPADLNPWKIRKADKDFAKYFDFKDIKFLIKTRDIHERKTKNCIGISIFDYGNKEKYPIYLSKNISKRHVDILLIGEEGKRDYILIKDFNSFMYDHILHWGRKRFFVIVYRLLAPQKFSKVMLRIALRLTVNKWLRCLKKVNTLD